MPLPTGLGGAWVGRCLVHRPFTLRGRAAVRSIQNQTQKHIPDPIPTLSSFPKSHPAPEPPPLRLPPHDVDGKSRKNDPRLEYRNLGSSLVAARNAKERGRRKVAFVVLKLKEEPGTMVLLAGTLAAVYALALWEAMMNVKAGVPFSDVFRFVVRFANANTFTALTNTSIAPETIASSLRLSPDLFNFVPVTTDVSSILSDSAGAENRLHALYARAGRGIAAGYMGIAALLRLFNWTFLAGNVFRQRVLAGREPPFVGVQERVFRLCGRVSDTLTMSLAKDGEHLLPIIEDPSVLRHLLTTHTKNGTVPIAWTVRKSDYGSPVAWEGLLVDEPALLTTKDGKRLLYIEADGTNSEDALHLGTASADLSIEDASAAFRMIEDTAIMRGNLPEFECVRVFIGDILQKDSTGGGKEFTLKQRIRFRHEVDILVDSKLPILTEIIKWADATAAPGWQERKVVFETDSQEYYQNLSALLGTYGFTVLDIADISAEEAQTLPRLIYYRRTASTVNALRATIDTTDSPAPPLCTVIDTKEGLDTLQHLAHAQLPASTTVICSSDLYDATLRQIRAWSRAGFSPKEIQKELDARSAYVARLAAAIVEVAEERRKEAAAAATAAAPAAAAASTPAKDPPPKEGPEVDEDDLLPEDKDGEITEEERELDKDISKGE